MQASTKTRRAFLGQAAAGAALLAPAAMVSRSSSRVAPTDPSVARTPGGISELAATRSLDAGELSHWRALVGERFRFAGRAQATLTRVTPVATSGRPAGLRQQGYEAYFTLDAAHTLAGGALHALDHPVLGRSTLFLTRVADQGGRAVLRAMFD